MVNRATLLGNVGQDPEIKYTQAGLAVANFSIATSEKWKDKDGKRQEKTEWHRIVAWDKLAEIVKDYVTKGKQLYIEGKIQTRKWQDRDGNTRYSTEIVAQRIQLLGGPRDDGDTGHERAQRDDRDDPKTRERELAKTGEPAEPGLDDDIPF